MKAGSKRYDLWRKEVNWFQEFPSIYISIYSTNRNITGFPLLLVFCMLFVLGKNGYDDRQLVHYRYLSSTHSFHHFQLLLTQDYPCIKIFSGIHTVKGFGYNHYSYFVTEISRVFLVDTFVPWCPLTPNAFLYSIFQVRSKMQGTRIIWMRYRRQATVLWYCLCTKNRPGTERCVRDIEVFMAAEWLRHLPGLIYEGALKQEEGWPFTKYLNLWTGGDVMTVERWQWWKNQLERYVREGLPEADSVLATVQVMEAVESN